jgi:hypothetical protein
MTVCGRECVSVYEAEGVRECVNMCTGVCRLVFVCLSDCVCVFL